MIELDDQVIQELQSTFDIKFAVDCRDFDTNPQVLINLLQPFCGQYFGPKDKILLIHMDTDYYDPLLPCGRIPINIVRIFYNLDIPFHSILFVTNHFGIQKEFDLLLQNHHVKDRPLIIETLLSSILFGHQLEKDFGIDLRIDQIEKQAICMMNHQRSHRVALYNFILDNKLLDKIAVSQHFNA
jgi:hypothetical protein